MRSEFESWYGKFFYLLIVLAIGGFTAINIRGSILKGTVISDLMLFLPFIVWIALLGLTFRFMPARHKNGLREWLSKSRRNSFMFNLALFGSSFALLSHESVVERIFMILSLATFNALVGPYLEEPQQSK